MKTRSFKLILMMVAVIFSSMTVPAGKAFASPEAAPASSGSSGEMIHIMFAPGTTSAEVSGSLAANAKVQYILRAGYAQLMDVSLSAPEGATLTVTSLAGTALNGLPGTGSTTAFRGYLPRTGNYVLTVSAGSKAVSYSLNVSIPQRISFKWGTTSATLTGSLKAHTSHDYILGAGQGQLMEITITPTGSSPGPQIIVYGVDGSVLQSGMGEATSFRGLLPLSQDYFVTVRAGDQDMAFTMNVIIPKRITFAAGSNSTTFSGWLPAQQSQYYSLNGQKDQTLTVDILPANRTQLIIYGMDGTVLRSGMGEGSSFSGKLPSTQDYILVVRTGVSAAWYKLVVAVK